ncbi:AraC family transcriptional regulator [Rhodococcus sp. TAF43]|uniref:AraC family transcriptional regulator n=1 Tax=unclassified Rhodococcus (in: high G+C Gram-positive bacteria) TaxID=192944 RepID=UPI000E0A2C2A|nr:MULTISPECIES: AraC family transcriptional regulator [unclassified Rhodococcus (in: high G+C Gram-positive bacteria)]QKT14019.1 AraC family transcriptional regulator [Rhodococcus sp. W8901]RDI35930.1 AraC family transcriptional regulator [Rhodococcus sp. AG1013]
MNVAADPGDWDEAENVVSNAYFPHDLMPLSAGSEPHLNVRAMQIGPLRLARIGWGAEVSVDTEHPGGYAVNIPLSGRIESVTAGGDVISGVGKASVFRPDTPAVITRWTADCEIVGVKVDRDYLHRELGRVLGRPDRRLPDQVDLSTEAGQTWMALLRSIVQQARGGEGLWQTPVVAEQLSGAITGAFVLAAMPDDAAAAPRPRIVKRVLDRIDDDPSLAWTASDMAEAAGVSVRRLQEGFREYLGMCPRDYLLDVRLSRIHDDLVTGDPSVTSVTDVALRWGITHTGRFAAAYRRKYGYAPSETLRS